jgi:hypothetical protein
MVLDSETDASGSCEPDGNRPYDSASRRSRQDSVSNDRYGAPEDAEEAPYLSGDRKDSSR